MSIKDTVNKVAKRVKNKVNKFSENAKEAVDTFFEPQKAVDEIEGDREAFVKECVERDAKTSLAHEAMKEAARRKRLHEYD